MTAYFAKYSDDGIILFTGECPDSMIELQVAMGNIYVGRVISSEAQYIKDGELYTYTSDELLSKINLKPGWVWKMPDRLAIDPRGLDEAKTMARNRVKEARSKAETANFMYNSIYYQVDKERITSAAVIALAAKLSNTEYSIDWIAADNSIVTLNADGIIGLSNAQGTQISNAFATSVALYSAIESATSKDAADAINWP